ncbi:ABC transporter permease [Amycolatopsis pithecellobii]|uniref:ABC transporter permease subunit n=1 Tax=Amycolatopsis pithecellobii TaxID=664692 RepID=A0A6N7Z4Z5_9PSEU|nr:ABC transporter permease [Amycolatopsis pithecellobii]MTD55651.1 ABC transporter permease subunit [Amycolatopsis pithecellobii]
MTRTHSLPGAANPVGVAVVVVAIVMWQLLVALRILDYSFLPSAGDVGGALWQLARSGELLDSVGHTLLVTLVASAIAIVIGVAAGLALGMLPLVHTFSMASVDFFRTLPVTAMIPAILLVWGPTAEAEIIAATYAAAWQIVVNTTGGVRATHPRLLDVARTFGLTREQTVRKIVLPAAMPAILVGARLAIVSALVVAIVAEMLINPAGLGWGLVQGQQALQPGVTWAYAVTAGILGYLLNAGLMWAARRMPGGRVPSSSGTSAA